MGQHTQGPWIINLDPRYPSEPCIDAVIDGVVWHVAMCHNAAGPDDGSTGIGWHPLIRSAAGFVARHPAGL